MTTNEILKACLAPFRSILILLVPIFDLVIGITFLIPLWSHAYRAMVTVLWLPPAGYMRAAGFLHRKIFFLRPLIALVTIPILVPVDFLMALICGPEEDARDRRALAIAAWPAEGPRPHSPRPAGGMPARPYLGFAALAAIRRCPHCHNIIPAGREMCVYCGRNTRDLSLPPLTTPSRALPLNRKAILHCADPVLYSAGRIQSCPLCGDMVRSTWEKCPRCGQTLEGLWGLPSLVKGKETPMSQPTPLADSDAS